MRIDRVIADRPEHAADVQQQRRPGERAGDRGPADQRSPIEIEAEKYLRPIGDALHERVGADQPENGSPEQDRNAIEAEQNRRPDRQLEQQKDHRLAHRNGAARQRPQPGARDLRVIIPVGDIVQRAAGAAHRDGAYRKEQQQDWIGPAPRGERNSPPAWGTARAKYRSADRAGPAGHKAGPARAASAPPSHSDGCRFDRPALRLRRHPHPPRCARHPLQQCGRGGTQAAGLGG